MLSRDVEVDARKSIRKGSIERSRFVNRCVARKKSSNGDIWIRNFVMLVSMQIVALHVKRLYNKLMEMREKYVDMRA